MRSAVREDRRPVRAIPVGETMTKQAMKDECDIHQILKQFTRTGVLTHVRESVGEFFDVPPHAADYHEALTIVAEAQSMFMELPSRVRARFDNDPGEFVAFCEDPANRDEMIELGLIDNQALINAKAAADEAAAAAPAGGPAPEDAAPVAE